MVLRIIILQLILLYSFNLTAQDTPESEGIPFVAYWYVGDTYDFQVSKIKRQWKGEELTKFDSTSYIATFEVIDSTASSYTVRWSYDMDLTALNIPEEFSDTFSDFEHTEVIYTTDELGTFMEILNWEELAGRYSDMYKSLFALAGNDGQEVEKMLKEAMAMFSSKESIEYVVFKELQSFHFPFGVEFSADEVIEYEDALPNILGGDPLRADASIYVYDVDYEDYYCVLVQEMKINSEDAQEMVGQLFSKLGVNEINETFSEFIDQATFDIEDSNVFGYYYDPGVPMYIETERNTTIKMDAEEMLSQEILRIEYYEEE